MAGLLVGVVVIAGTATTAGAATIASSKFTNDADGWKVLGDTGSGTENATHVPSGGDPGGYISIQDAAIGGVMYWRAPASFRKHAEDAYKGILRYSLRQSANSNQFVADDVLMTGGGVEIHTQVGFAPALAPTWTDFTVGLSKAGWTDVTGSPEPATGRDLKTVLKDLDSLLIRAEYETGPDVDDLDTVALKDTPPPPE